MRSHRSRLAGLASALLALAGACASTTDEGGGAPAISLTIVSGSGQTGAAGSELPSPLQVKVTDNGKILKDYLVTFRVISGGGRMYAGTALTDSRGIAQDWWRLGPTAGLQRVDVVAVDPLTGVKQNFGSFTATATSQAVLSLTPATQTFGSVGVGTPGSGQIFTVSNTGGAVSGALLIEIEGAHPGDFGTSNSTCAGTLNPGGTCNVTVTFAPTATGARTASLKASASPGGSALASLSGTGLAGASLLISPTPFDFGAVPAEFGSASTPRTFTVTNSGGAASGQLVVFLSGSDPGHFETQLDGCSGQSLPGGGFCEITIRFKPTAQGERFAALNVLGKPAETAQASLEGTGVVPHLSLSPQDVNFGNVPVGQGEGVQMTVTNDGQAEAHIAAVDAGGNANFSITNNLCPAVLAINASCSFTVVFQPTTVGLKSSSLVVAGNAAATAVLIGAGVTPANLVISPNPQGFGTVPLGNTSSATLTVINTGGATSGTVDFGITGTNSGDFAEIAGGTCSSTSLVPGASCTVVVGFSPTEIGARTAILQATASPGGTANANLTGTGVAPAELLVTPFPQDFGGVTVGGSGSPFLFTVTNIGAVVSGSVSLSLTGTNASDFELAAGGTCVSGETVLAPGGSCTVNVIFTPISTGPRQAALRATATPGGTSDAAISGTGN